MYQFALFELVVLGRSFADSVGRLYPGDLWARVQIFSLSLIFRLWDRPHYRCASFQQVPYLLLSWCIACVIRGVYCHKYTQFSPQFDLIA
jgi:hypothetical protein